MERRSEYRVYCNDSIHYRMSHAGDYKTGILRNTSISGALLWLKENLAVDNSLELLTESHNETEHVHMRVVRTEETNLEGYKGYGCVVEMRVSEAA